MRTKEIPVTLYCLVLDCCCFLTIIILIIIISVCFSVSIRDNLATVRGACWFDQ